MNLLRVLFVIQFIGISAYTIYVGTQDGWDLANVFFGDLFALNWSGQFNFDFLNYLLLSGIWVAWRNGFSMAGILLGLLAFIMGIFFFAPYLFYLSSKTKGNIRMMLLGDHFST